VATALENGDVAHAALRLKELTGKDTVESTEAGVAHATVEAILKQGNKLVRHRFSVPATRPLGA